MFEFAVAFSVLGVIVVVGVLVLLVRKIFQIGRDSRQRNTSRNGRDDPGYADDQESGA